MQKKRFEEMVENDAYVQSAQKLQNKFQFLEKPLATATGFHHELQLCSGSCLQAPLLCVHRVQSACNC